MRGASLDGFISKMFWSLGYLFQHLEKNWFHSFGLSSTDEEFYFKKNC